MSKNITCMRDIYLDNAINEKPYPLCPNCGGHIKIEHNELATSLKCINCGHSYYCENILKSIDEWNDYCKEYKKSSKSIFMFSIIIGFITSFITLPIYSIFAFGLTWSILSLIDQLKVEWSIERTICRSLLGTHTNNICEQADNRLELQQMINDINNLFQSFDLNSKYVKEIQKYNYKINQYYEKYGGIVSKNIIKYNSQILSLLRILQEMNELYENPTYINVINETLCKYELLFKDEYIKLTEVQNIDNQAHIQVIQDEINSRYEYLNLFRKDKLDEIIIEDKIFSEISHIVNGNEQINRETHQFLINSFKDMYCEFELIFIYMNLMCSQEIQVKHIFGKMQEELYNLSFKIQNAENITIDEASQLYISIHEISKLVHNFRLNDQFKDLNLAIDQLIHPMTEYVYKLGCVCNC